MENTNLLDTFSLDDSAQFDFETGQVEIKKKEEEEKPAEGEKKPEADVFNELNNIVKDEKDESQKDEQKEKVLDPKVKALFALKEQGFINFDESELKEDDDLEEVFNSKITEAVDNKIIALFEELPEAIRELNRLAIDGGDYRSFMKMLANHEDIAVDENTDITKEYNQELVIRKHLTLQGQDEEYIEAHIKTLKDLNKLEASAKKSYNTLISEMKRQRQEVLKQQEEAKKLSEARAKEFKANLQNILKESNNISGVSITAEDKKVLVDYISKPTVKLENGNIISEMQRDYHKVLKNQKSLVLLAKILRNVDNDGNFNLEPISKSLQTKIATEIKEDLQRNKLQASGVKSGASKPKTLAELFN